MFSTRQDKYPVAIFYVTTLIATTLISTAHANAVQQRFNRAVIVEGNCSGSSPNSRTSVTPGTCGDYDGDGRTGTLEDTDEDDGVFGTINAALGTGGINQGGSVTIVASGTFSEAVKITAANGNVTLQAAPGVEANIDGSGLDSNSRTSGIKVDVEVAHRPGSSYEEDFRYVVLRNLAARNWGEGIGIGNNVFRQTQRYGVAIEGCRLYNNVEYGILIRSGAEVTVARTEIYAVGLYTLASASSTISSDKVNSSGAPLFPCPERINAAIGIAFFGQSSGTVSDTIIKGTLGAAIRNSTGNRSAICIHNVTARSGECVFVGVNPSAESCGGSDVPKGRTFRR